MTTGPDRRRLIAGLGAAGALAGCGRAAGASEAPRALDLSALEVRHGGRLGLCAATDDGQVHWRGDERFLYCSTFKLFLAAAVLQRVEQGALALDHAVPITADDLVFHAPVTEPAVGGRLTVEQLCRAAVEVSDNVAANLLIRELGGLDAWRAWFRDLGDAVTRVDRWETALNRPDGDLDTTAPAQAVANLATLFTAARPRLGEAARARLLGWLEGSPTGATRIRAGLPAGWRDATKTGTSGRGHANDIGLVLPPTGEPVRIAIYFEAPEATSADQQDAVIAEAAALAVGALGHG